MRVRMALSGRSPVAAARFSYMIDAGGRRDGAGHGRMRDDELENDLRPARAADLRRPAGQRMALDLSEQRPQMLLPGEEIVDLQQIEPRREFITLPLVARA